MSARPLLWRLAIIGGAALALPGCTATQSLVTCDNAARVRAAASLAMQALDRACPMDAVR